MSRASGIAVVGMACRFPDARTPHELFENAMAQRRAFRRIPDERLRLSDYYAEDRSTPDHIYSQAVAVIEGYEFDRLRFRVSGPAYRSVDLTHWLALDVASQALADAGFADGAGLPHEQTGVFVGNTLAGEFSRANVMRLRWPYVRRVLEHELVERGWAHNERVQFVQKIEAEYKSAFPPVGEETLAGGMSNTIAGRISNHFDLKGGGYVVDGACASSLLAIANAAGALESGDLDVAVAGGVDLSLDPFELVGFAKTGALAAGKMRVFDARSDGFCPGEGCGFVVLMRVADAIRHQRRIYALLQGWGVSSDGSGGMTRPEAEGQLLALRRAYRRAGFGPDQVSYFEAHGTGTAVGDATELSVLSRALRESADSAAPAALSTIKGNIGHTKAAAGVAGLIKASMAIYYRVLPPITGCEIPHPMLRDSRHTPVLRLLRRAEHWPGDRPRRAAVSAMGFGGINTHVVLEEPPRQATPPDVEVPSPSQDAELFLFAAESREELANAVDQLAAYAARLSEAELTDVAAALQRALGVQPYRAAIVAGTPDELASRLNILAGLVNKGATKLDAGCGMFVAHNQREPRIGLLFPGQGSPAHLSGGVWGNRFACVKELYDNVTFSREAADQSTEIAQPAIMRAALAGLRVIDELGIDAVVGIGHSLGELAALHWAGAYDDVSLLRLATLRGKVMGETAGPAGAMASLHAEQERVKELLDGDAVVIAAVNSPSQTVIAGPVTAVNAVMDRARTHGVDATRLRVSHAFHSPLVADSVPVLDRNLRDLTFAPLRKRVVSTVSGAPLTAGVDIPNLLCKQITSPVRFTEALRAAAEEVDLWLEVGPGHVLSTFARDTLGPVTALALDAGGPSVEGLLKGVGAAFVLGAPIRMDALFRGRLTRPFNLDWRPTFFQSPCETAPCPIEKTEAPPQATNEDYKAVPEHLPHEGTAATLDVVRALVADRAELPLQNVTGNLRLLSDLHLNSIIVGQIVVQAARLSGVPPPLVPTQYADATISDVATALEELRRAGGSDSENRRESVPPGVDGWVRCFRMELIEKALNSQPLKREPGSWILFGDGPEPLVAAFRNAFSEAPGRGVVVCLFSPPNERQAALLLDAAHEVLKSREGNHFVVVQNEAGGAFARSLFLEAPEVACCVVNVPAGHADAPRWAVGDAVAAKGYVEAHYDSAGTRREPSLRLAQFEDWPVAKEPVGPNDVLLVTGGGKGIAAECALDLARRTGVRLALIGRSVPDCDPALASNLDRMTTSGATVRYINADVTDSESVRSAIEQAEKALGPITAVLHGAGVNSPRLIPALSVESMRTTLRPKVNGLQNVLATIDPNRLRLLVTFGSLIARTGLRGEADYGLANEWLRVGAEQWHNEHPSCRCLHLDWSVWAGIGMGERLGRLEALMQQGVTPIPVDEGVRILSELIRRDVPERSLTITGRFGAPPTIPAPLSDVPFLRFLEHVRTFVPGVELIADAELSSESDPYLEDHIFDGERLFPGVLGIEAMAQIGMTLLNSKMRLDFEDVEFRAAVAVPAGQTVTIRIAGLVTGRDRCRLVIRSSATGFQVDHFRGTCRIAERREQTPSWPRPDGTGQLVPLDPAEDLYGRLLFHSGRFRRVRRYHRLRAMECVAEIAPGASGDWFSRYLPNRLVLGDPGARDAAIHAIQACIPQACLLPEGVERISLMEGPATAARFLRAAERENSGDVFVYDVQLASVSGHLLEEWRGLRLRRIREVVVDSSLAAPLLGPYLERRVAELIPGWTPAIVVQGLNHGNGRRAESERAIVRAAGVSARVVHRPDGKPELAGVPYQVSASHSRSVTLAISDDGPVSCDVEEVAQRSDAAWRDLLQSRYSLAALIEKRTGWTQSVAATHVWMAQECVVKITTEPGQPLCLERVIEPGACVLRCGSRLIATVQIPPERPARVFAFLRH